MLMNHEVPEIHEATRQAALAQHDVTSDNPYAVQDLTLHGTVGTSVHHISGLRGDVETRKRTTVVETGKKTDGIDTIAHATLYATPDGDVVSNARSYPPQAEILYQGVNEGEKGSGSVKRRSDSQVSTTAGRYRVETVTDANGETSTVATVSREGYGPTAGAEGPVSLKDPEHAKRAGELVLSLSNKRIAKQLEKKV